MFDSFCELRHIALKVEMSSLYPRHFVMEVPYYRFYNTLGTN